MKMKHFLCLCFAMVTMAACQEKKAAPEEDDYELEMQAFVEAGTIEEKADLLFQFGTAAAERYCDETLKELDPHACWLYECISRMFSYPQTPEDEWAYYLAVQRCINEYHAKLDRKSSSIEFALYSIRQLFNQNGESSQRDMNHSASLYCMTSELRTMDQYNRIMQLMQEEGDDEGLNGLYGKEFLAWFDVLNKTRRILLRYTFREARYSSAPMEINSIIDVWHEGRWELLKKEYEYILFSDPEKYNLVKYPASERDLADCINYLYNCEPTAGWENIYTQWIDDDDQVMQPFLEGAEVENHVRLMAYELKIAIKHWQMVRQEIEDFLPESKKVDYRQLTQDMITHIYNMLETLGNSRY